MEQLTSLQEIKVDYARNYKGEAVCHSSHAAELCRQAFNQTHASIDLKEYAFIILLNRSNCPIGYYKLSEGGVSGCVVDPKIAFSVALSCLACGIILCHSHPSGSLKPSTADTELTRKFKASGELLDITLLDHIILTSESYCSYADEGLL